MKHLLNLVFITITSTASAQWSNTDNQYFDTLHMPVSTTVLIQKNPLVINSYPDGGYFVIWEDERNYATTKTDIYAQKYDAAGKRLWAENGVPVSNGPNAQRYTFSSNQDYRNRSFAATDSAGGFYIAYIDDSTTNYSWERIMVQHMRNNGTVVFSGAGYVITAPISGDGSTFSAPFLIADGSKGFYISYSRNVLGSNSIYVYNYKDENGNMTFYGGGRVNENAVQTSSVAPCGLKTDLVYPGTTVSDYNIWYDLQGGCNVIMNMSGNIGSQGKMLCYNRVWRAKKDSKVKTLFRNTSSIACPKITDYKKGNVYILYKLETDYYTVICGGSGSPIYTYTNYRLLSNGYQVIDEKAYDYNFPKGVTLSTPGDINVDLIAVNKRTYANNVVSDFTVQGFAYSAEKFDSIPFQRASFSNPELGFNPNTPTMNKLNFFRDTLLAPGRYYYDFSLAGGGSEIFSSALIWENDGSGPAERKVRLQHLRISKQNADSFAIKYNTNIVGTPIKTGVMIGREVSTGFGGSNISYDMPLITVNSSGKALFYIREYYRSARVSPISSGAALDWGAMGKPIGTGIYNNNYYNLEQPVASIDALGGTGLIAFRDNRFLPGATGENIFMRHLDRLEDFNYSPPNKPVKLVANPYGATAANPAVLAGSSNHYTTIEAYSSYGNSPGTSPVAELMDNYNLGRVEVNIFQNSGAIRKYNGQPYLNRNITIKTEYVPAGADIDLILFFTKQEFDALKAADNTILDPGYLSVIRQPNGNLLTTPNAYTPVLGEEVLTPIIADSVAGGYRLKVIAKGFGNFFIQKISTVQLCKGASSSFVSDVAGTTYQWQVNTDGTNFYSISNTANYGGTSTGTLQLTNIPSSFNAYRYRCVINGTKVSKTFYLQVANIWTGAISTAWENPGNWSCGTVPDANTDVVINAGTVVVSSNQSCRSFKINPGVSFTVNAGFKLTVTN